MNNKRKMRETLYELDVKEFREFMGPEMVGTFTDGEVMQLKREMETLADILIELYFTRQREEVGKDNDTELDTGIPIL